VGGGQSAVSLVFAAIAPHGGIAVPEAVAPEALAGATAAGMEELGRRIAAARPDTIAVFTPHNVHVEGHFAVIEAGRLAGTLEGAREPLRLEAACDRELALALLEELRAAGLPAAGVSYGGNDASAAVMPMDWAVLIPLWFLGGRSSSPPPVVAVAPARDRPLEEHVEAGGALVRAADRLNRRLAVVASADHGHAHRADGPYGFHQAAAEYDSRIQDIVRAGDLGLLLDLDPGWVADARADSWWQMLMLHGALGGPARADLISYEAPTYFGMLTAELRRS
jgi:aromatic ring-opening dioxygenase LigB subunit